MRRARAGGGAEPTPWDAQFRTAGTTKTFTTTVVLQLAAEGRLSPDATEHPAAAPTGSTRATASARTPAPA
ncbi:serine hydrolase [Streptomyces caatingaensis]|uniref:serine hydrolase n=1 Tax=Streptomyces caatingaensis TaxID=1678637 RepID=UPI001F51C156|nr:serine hydrolase [Streptomyces caatingaensis]